MISNLLKFTLTLTNHSPILLILWIVNLLNYFSINKVDNSAITVPEQVLNLSLPDYYLLFGFITCVLLSGLIMRLINKTLTIQFIELKSIKSADINFTPIFISYCLPWAKLYFTDKNFEIYLGVAIVILFTVTYISKGSYHFNPILRVVFGYRHFEVQTKSEVTYIMLSKQKLLDPKLVSSYIHITDYVILNPNNHNHASNK